MRNYELPELNLEKTFNELYDVTGSSEIAYDALSIKGTKLA